jgi:arginine decarboxylase
VSRTRGGPSRRPDPEYSENPETPPRPEDLEPPTVMLPRDAFFGPAEQVSARSAVGRAAAEMVSPYPPGVPAVAPGERISRGVVEYLSTGVDEGMFIPDSFDPTARTLRVVSR